MREHWKQMILAELRAEQRMKVKDLMPGYKFEWGGSWYTVKKLEASGDGYAIHRLEKSTPMYLKPNVEVKVEGE